jgi:hypothetical protein
MARQLAGGRQDQPDDAALRGAVRRLADLPLIGGHRRGQHDQPALAIAERVEPGHVGGGEAQQVEAADQIDFDRAAELVERQGPVASDDAARRTDAGAGDDEPRRPVPPARRGDRRFGVGGVRHIAGRRNAADLLGDRDGRGFIDIEHGDPRPGLRQSLRGRPAEPRAAAADQCRLTGDLHLFLRCFGRVSAPPCAKR